MLNNNPKKFVNLKNVWKIVNKMSLQIDDE